MLTAYEQKALRELRTWQAEAPSWGTQLLAKPGSKVAQVMQVLVPPNALRAALEGSDRLGRRFSDRKSILKRSGVESLEDIRGRSLEDNDQLAKSVTRRALALGGASGAVFGIAGAFGLAADIPTLLTLAFRTIHRVGLCYGEEPSDSDARGLGIGIFALVSANSMEEKQFALQALQSGAGVLGEAAWRDGIERVTERELAKEATVYSLQNLARAIGVNLGQRKAAGAIPVLGAAVGATVNAWYLNDVARTARYVFHERWLGE